MVETRYVIGGTEARREVVVGRTTQSQAKDREDFLVQLGKVAPFETGLMPPGVVSYRQAGSHSQLVIERPPAVNLVIWGAHEGDRGARTYTLAQPYCYIIGDFISGNFLGCRLFYSPVPIAHPEMPLYLANVPNYNIRGYRGNGIGWICNYHKDSTAKMTIGQRALYLVRRAGGEEAYNDGNMSETDGPRFYADHKKPAYTHDPKAWEKKTEKEGVTWALDEKLWIPALVKGIDDQGAYDPKGKPLTLGMAMTGNAQCYYQDPLQPKPINALARKIKFQKDMDWEAMTWGGAFVASREPRPFAPPCALCGEPASAAAEITGVTGPVCQACVQQRCFACPRCAHWYPRTTSTVDVDSGQRFCTTCFTGVECAECGHTHDAADPARWLHDVGERICLCCTPHFLCTGCNHYKPNDQQHRVLGAGRTIEFLCDDCTAGQLLCPHCELLRPEAQIFTTRYGHLACTSCARSCNECGHHTLREELEGGLCPVCREHINAEPVATKIQKGAA